MSCVATLRLVDIDDAICYSGLRAGVEHARRVSAHPVLRSKASAALAEFEPIMAYFHEPPCDDDSGGGGGVGEQRKYYVYLMSSRPSMENGRKLYTYVGKSQEPARQVLRCNRYAQHLAHAAGKQIDTNWCLEQWIGPFSSREKAARFQRMWLYHTRGARARVERGVILAHLFGFTCYSPYIYPAPPASLQ